MARRRTMSPIGSRGGYQKELGPPNRQYNKRYQGDNLRGGFSITNMPPGARKHIQDAADHVANGRHGKAGESIKKAGLAAMKETAFERVHKVINGDDNRQRPFNVEGGNAERIDAPHHETSDKPHTAVVSHERSKTHTLGSVVARTHKTRIETGRPISQALWRRVKDNGITRKVIYDSKVSATGEKYYFTRDQLNHNSGFNSRNFLVLGPTAYINMTDFANMSGIAVGDTTPLNSDQKAYFDVIDTSSEFQFHNQSSYTKCEMKIHLVKQRGTSNLTPVNEFLTGIINTSTLTQQEGRFPVWYQHSAGLIEAGETSPDVTAGDTISWEHSLKGPGLLSSPNFKDTFKICKTVTKTLDAGDIWNVRHTHKYGPGLDVDTVYKNFSQAGNDSGERYAPANYFYIIESKGQTVEGIFNRNSNRETYIGTGPSYYALEARKTFRFARLHQTGATGTATGFPEGQMGLRVYTSSPLHAEDQKEFYVLPEDIKEVTSIQVGEMYIPVLSDSTRVLNSSTSLNEDNT